MVVEAIVYPDPGLVIVTETTVPDCAPVPRTATAVVGFGATEMQLIGYSCCRRAIVNYAGKPCEICEHHMYQQAFYCRVNAEGGGGGQVPNGNGNGRNNQNGLGGLLGGGLGGGGNNNNNGNVGIPPQFPIVRVGDGLDNNPVVPEPPFTYKKCPPPNRPPKPF